MCVCIYIYIYTHTQLYIYIYETIFRSSGLEKSWRYIGVKVKLRIRAMTFTFYIDPVGVLANRNVQ